ncbi:MAG: type II secretion system F family protein [Fidelibacterota bacterium]
MSHFRYVAVDPAGKRREGRVEALSREEAGQAVRKMGITVLDIQPVKPDGRKINLREIHITRPRVDPSLKVAFFRELSTLVNAGIQLDDGLAILKHQFKDRQFSRALEDVSELVRTGYPFSDALKRHPRIFRRLVISLIKAAEMGGGLGKILDQIAHYIEREENIRKRLKSATSYPKFIFAFFGLVLAGVVFGLLPKFKDIYDTFGAELPGSTVVILGVSTFVKNHLFMEVGLIVLMVVGFKLFQKSERGRRYIDEHIFSVPIAGSLLHKSVVTRISQTLSVLLKSGVPLIDALKIAGETADNVYVDETIEEIGRQVSRGKSLAAQLSRFPTLFPVMVSSMIAVGEKSGALPLMLGKVAEFHDQDFGSRVDRLTKTIEPIIMGGLGVVVCIIVLALYLPIFRMTEAIQ